MLRIQGMHIPVFTTANNPNCAMAKAKNVKIKVAMAFLTKVTYFL